MYQDPSTNGEPADSLRPGTPLLQGQFLVEGFLNAGGFGITYYARDSLERRVVIKECYPASMCCRSSEIVHARSRDQQDDFDAIVHLFGREARRLAKLDHPNIVGVRDVFEDNGTAYMALDFVDGRDLLDVIEQESQRLTPDMIRDMTFALLDAISHVHGMGMLHRDISPDNILIDADNAPVLIDFGAARDTARRKSRVLSGLHVVKDGYSPQEFYLAHGDQGPSSDLYSLAATLHHVLTGAPPTFGHLRMAALAERSPDPYVPLVGRVPGFDDAFLGAIDKALSVFPKQRLQSAGAWMDAIMGRAEQALRPTSRVAPTSRDALTIDSQRISQPTPALDPAIDDKIRALVESTNPEVKRVQERAAEEKAARVREAEEEEQAREAARQRRLELARAEAAEAAAFACKVTPRRVVSKGVCSSPRPLPDPPDPSQAHDAPEDVLAEKPPSFLRRTLCGLWPGASRRSQKVERVGT
ncbi:MAG: serine/threonine-protein kinase [Pseudomonadota bacterium]